MHTTNSTMTARLAPGTVDTTAPRRRFIDVAATAVPVVILAALLIVGTVVNDHFWAWSNLRNLLTQNVPLALVAFGMTLVLITGAFDLSVGAIFAMGAVTFALLAQTVALPLAAVLAVLTGVGIGAVNGYVVAGLKVNPFIGTIATGAIFTGVVFIISDSSPVPLRAEGADVIGLGSLGPIPWAVIVAAIAGAGCAFLLNQTIAGRHMFAVGGNAKAALLNGVPVAATITASFVIVGALSALAGIITASQLGLGQPTLGVNTALDAFAIVVIGGTSVYGGRGAIWRTLVGLLIIAVMTNIFNALVWDSTRQSLVKGLILLLAVALEAKRHRTN